MAVIFPLIVFTILCVHLEGVVADCDSDEDRRSGWFTPMDNRRGTASILWSCLSTLFICLWVTLHLNVPAAGETHNTHLRRKFKWMFIAILSPEFVAWNAAHQWYRAKRSCKEMQELPWWTISHAFYANMGGFTSGSLPIDADDIRELAKADAIRLDSIISEREIQDKSKADGLGKFIACVQATWFAVQFFSRVYYQQPITQLERATLGYIWGALVTFCFLWNKPRDVSVATPIYLKQGRDGELEGARAKNPRLKFCGHTEHRIANNRYTFGSHFKPFDWLFVRKVVIKTLVMVAFTGIYFVKKWNFCWSTNMEWYIWVGCSSLVAGLGFLCMWTSHFLQLRKEYFHHRRWVAPIAMCGLIFGVYASARFALLVEAFWSLREVDPSVYLVLYWDDYLPHF